MQDNPQEKQQQQQQSEQKNNNIGYYCFSPECKGTILRRNNQEQLCLMNHPEYVINSDDLCETAKSLKDDRKYTDYLTLKTKVQSMQALLRKMDVYLDSMYFIQNIPMLVQNKQFENINQYLDSNFEFKICDNQRELELTTQEELIKKCDSSIAKIKENLIDFKEELTTSEHESFVKGQNEILTFNTYEIIPSAKEYVKVRQSMNPSSCKSNGQEISSEKTPNKKKQISKKKKNDDQIKVKKENPLKDNMKKIIETKKKVEKKRKQTQDSQRQTNETKEKQNQVSQGQHFKQEYEDTELIDIEEVNENNSNIQSNQQQQQQEQQQQQQQQQEQPQQQLQQQQQQQIQPSVFLNTTNDPCTEEENKKNQDILDKYLDEIKKQQQILYIIYNNNPNNNNNNNKEITIFVSTEGNDVKIYKIQQENIIMDEEQFLENSENEAITLFTKVKKIQFFQYEKSLFALSLQTDGYLILSEIINMKKKETIYQLYTTCTDFDYYFEQNKSEIQIFTFNKSSFKIFKYQMSTKQKNTERMKEYKSKLISDSKIMNTNIINFNEEKNQDKCMIFYTKNKLYTQIMEKSDYYDLDDIDYRGYMYFTKLIKYDQKYGLATFGLNYSLSIFDSNHSLLKTYIIQKQYHEPIDLIQIPNSSYIIIIQKLAISICDLIVDPNHINKPKKYKQLAHIESAYLKDNYLFILFRKHKQLEIINYTIEDIIKFMNSKQLHQK